MLLRLLAKISCIAAATSVAAAEPMALSADDLRSILAGSHLLFDTPAGTQISVRFSKDGLVSGEGGVLASVLGAARDRGRWWTSEDKLCVKWFRWFEAETRCVNVRQDGERLYWNAADGRSGTATITERVEVAAVPAPVKAEVEPVKFALADAGASASVEAPKAELPKEAAPPNDEAAPKVAKANPASSPAEALAMRFAAAAMDVITPAPRTDEPRHLLDAPGRRALDPAPAANAVTSDSDAKPVLTAPLPPQQHKAEPARAPAPRRSAAAPSAAHASSTVIVASFRVARVDEDDMLNVRSGPSELYPSVGGLPPEVRGVEIVGSCQADWCPIRHGSLSGWVNRYFLAEETTGPAAASVQQ